MADRSLPDMVRKVADALPPRDRQIIGLHCGLDEPWDQIPGHEIAKRLGLRKREVTVAVGRGFGLIILALGRDDVKLEDVNQLLIISTVRIRAGIAGDGEPRLTSLG